MAQHLPSGALAEPAPAVQPSGAAPRLPPALNNHQDPPHEHSVPVPVVELSEVDLLATVRLTEAVAAAPEVGTAFLGFRLVAELGRGAFGRVYLALQEELGARQVVLKVSADTSAEAATLAQLLHTNVVPVYSIHRSGPFQAVCMPYLGRTTLADVLKVLGGRSTLPDSGKALVSTLHERMSGAARPEPSQPAPPAPPTESRSVPLKSSPEIAFGTGEIGSTVLLEKLAGLSYVGAILWLASRLADGLAHAHERGILHRDLKPANILLTDEGQPMLLDFNLAEDTKRRSSASAAQLGGTLPYMSPEQLRGFQGDRRPLDGRSDLYALGVILYEMLTGRQPFPVHSGPAVEALGQMLRDRAGTPPDLRRGNRAITPAVQSIIRRCLEVDLENRYQSARELQEDLERHLENLPLVHAGEPSLRERARKWRNRHPRLACLGPVAVLAAALFVCRSDLLGRIGAFSARDGGPPTHAPAAAAERPTQRKPPVPAAPRGQHTGPGKVRFAHGAAGRPHRRHAHGPERLARLEPADEKDEAPPAKVRPLGLSVCEEPCDGSEESPCGPLDGPNGHALIGPPCG